MELMDIKAYAGIIFLLVWTTLFVLVGLAYKNIKINPAREIKTFLKKQSVAGRIVFLLFFLVMTIYGGTKPSDNSDSTSDPNNISNSSHASNNNSISKETSTSIANEIHSSKSHLSLLPTDFSNEQKASGFILTEIRTDDSYNFALPTNGVAYTPWLKYGASDDMFVYEQNSPIITHGTNSYKTARIYSQGAISFGDVTLNVFDTIVGIPPTNNWDDVGEPMLWYQKKNGSIIYTWQDVLLNRAINENMSFQLEIQANGDIISRYDDRVTEYIKNHNNLNYCISTCGYTNGIIALNNTCSATNHTCTTIYEFSSTEGITALPLCSIIESIQGGFTLYWKNISNLSLIDEDNDGLSNFEEICIYKTDCNNSDTDGDNRSDSHEVQNGFSPVNADENNDSVPDGVDFDEWALHPLWCTNNTPSIIISLNTPITAGSSASLMLNDLTIPLSETNSWALTLPQGELVNVRLQSTSTEPIDLSLSYPNSDMQNYNNSVWIDDPAGIFDGTAYNAESQIAKPTYDIYVDGNKIEQNYCAHSDEIYFDINVYPSEIELDFSTYTYIDSNLEYVSGNQFKGECDLGSDRGYYCLVSYYIGDKKEKLDIYIDYHRCNMQLNGRCNFDDCYCNRDYIFSVDLPNLVMLRSQQDLIELKATHSFGDTTAINWEITPAVNDGARLHTSNTASDSGSNYINYQDKVYVSAGNELGEYTITARLSEFPEVTTTSTLKVIDVYCELICNEVDPTYGVINPAYVVKGMDSMFKAWIEPAVLVSNSNINASWSTSNSNITIVSNSLEKLIVRGNDLGECSLTLNIDDAQFITPKINTKVVNMVTNTIHACYNLSTTNVVNMTDLRADFSNRLEVVNQIYKQVGMYFLAGVVTNQVNDNWTKITYDTTGNNDIDYNMFDVLGQESGVKVFLVNDIDGYLGLSNNNLIILEKSADKEILPHEIGHICKLCDIYIKENNMSIDECISKISIPMDCSGLEHNLFYYIKFQSDIINRLLMNGKYTKGGIDISFGDIYGIWYERELGSKIYHKSLAPIGFETNGTRNLTIYGGNN